MKKMLLTIAAMILVMGLSAQDFAPSQQAQGYLDSKNLTVDYATGLFHYKVPIYTLKSGDFELPVSLNYVSKGVRKDDESGLVDYNWTLNVGGVVTRTIRGGVADEASQSGYLDQNFSNPPTAAQVEAVNKREADGESDIFTASFNGQSVHFMIKKEENNIIAEPLERTNVKIECEQGNSYSASIEGWVITDENGNKYYFRQKEWSADIVKEDAISFNGVRGKSYISSWYLNRIEPRNCEPVVYHYKDEADPNPYQQNDINTTKYYSFYESEYTYGRPMENRPFDFSKYQSSFDRDISAASSYLDGFSLEMQLNNNMYDFVYGNFIRNPNFEVISQNINANFRVMGQLADLTGLSEASNGVISILNQLIATYSNTGSYNADRAAFHFESAKYTMIRCLEEIEDITTQKTSGGSVITMKSPLLDHIICHGKKVTFEYKESNWGGHYTLKNINIRDILDRHVLQVQLRGYLCLRQLSFMDKDSVEFNQIKFDYYGSNGPFDYTYDIWGFPKKNNLEYPDYDFLQNTDDEYSKIKSLSKITNVNKGEIIIDYESNIIPDKYNPAEYVMGFGGIRVKSVVVKDTLTHTTDSIKYLYPYPGELVYRESYNLETVYYGDFSDQLRHSRAQNQGTAFLNTGNNGVYYNYVEEEFVGKGKKTYLFYNPRRFSVPSELSYKFWLNGLPLGSAVYDRNGNLKSVTKNYYQGETGEFDDIRHNPIVRDVCHSEKWFIGAVSATAYTNAKFQIKAYPYYMDAERLRSHYQNQSNVFLYQDGGSSYYINLYNAIYRPNIAPRTNVTLLEQRWALNYGGKVLLKSQEEYRLEGNYSTESSINHFTATDLGVPFNKIEYYYDNIESSVLPTRISKTDAVGDVYTSVERRICDMDVAGTMADMKSENILSPVVKQQNLKNNRLLNETVNVYSSCLADKKYFGMSEQKSYIPAGEETIPSFTAMDNSLFSYPASDYTLEKSLGYLHENHSYLPLVVAEKGDTLSCRYDFALNTEILQATGYSDRFISAENLFLHNLGYRDNDVDIIHYVYNDFDSVYHFINGIEQMDLPLDEANYLRSTSYLSIKKAIEAIVTKGQSIGYPEFRNYIDSISANPQWRSDFSFFCYEYIINDSIYLSIRNSLDVLYSMFFTESFYSTLQLFDVVGKKLSVRVDAVSDSGLKLCLLSASFDDHNHIYYTVTHSGGTSTEEVIPESKPYWNVQFLSLDLSGYTGITSVALSCSSLKNVAYIALVPEDCSFKATAYNADGTTFCKFDQNGQMERYEYDGAGRVVKVFDQNGRLLKENTYNAVIQ